MICVCAVGMLEKFKLSWRLTAHQHPLEDLKNPSHHARPLNSLVSLLNAAVYGPLHHFLDDKEDAYENGGESLDFPLKPEYESGQGVAPFS